MTLTQSFDDHPGATISATVVGLILVTVLAINVLVGISDRYHFEISLAEIEYLRSATGNVKPGVSQIVVGRAELWNEVIVANQRCNQLWYCDYLVSDKWDQVKPIELPEK